MPAVTIGVPVYNGDTLLNECLECLANQTFSNLEVLIYDNASTDSTASIARRWAARDARFRYFRQTETRDGLRNFSDVLNAATSEYFMWRAHDDLSAPNFVELLHELLSSSPDAKLAVCDVRSVSPGRVDKYRPLPDLRSGCRMARIRRVLLKSRPSWLYGLWRREALLENFTSMVATYPYVWACDHLVLLGLILDDSIVGSTATCFVQRMMEPMRRRISVQEVSAVERRSVRKAFATQCRAMIARRSFSALERAALFFLLPSYVNKCVYKRPRLVRAWMRELRDKARTRREAAKSDA